MSVNTEQYFVNGRQQNSFENLRFSFKNPDKSSLHGQLAGVLTTSTAQTDSFPSGNLQAVLAAIQITAVSGTTPTLVMNIQTSTTAGGTFTTIASTPTINAAGIYYLMAPLVEVAKGSNWYKVTVTIGGTTPSFTVAGVASQLFYLNNLGD
jgi:uncharacterized membrane protein YjgN (DUF898 family)